ncbi:ABC transporter ATP-binding protein [Actinoalloteichus sp. AHMU CJ021]|uniref:ABC transport system ATP-binding protein n=1 Tax=Actinoalloteichus caeruleus DSM 43889 TaxID=1120930 RepID=A0ABT1JC44_ACTCY|nr:ATP-binding cassette domain-containing protein [Actinoalloteichus caeruleus]AUS80679.1 ABC transporter ATP-binding protein [Actinoalloteichus sp. AHMU CJ021]MCP2330065.1 putative ABC transport system ATP-binding protein [Actinoalloteichus caeruleus DSM 43889]
MTVAEARLRVRGLGRGFNQGGGRIEVLDGLDLDVAAGEVVTVSGPSGSGKSTLFTLLAAFDRPDSGSVEVLGDEVTPLTPWTSLAVLPQTMGLSEELTLAENVALPLRMLTTRTPEEVADRVDSLLGGLGVAALADRYPLQVSFGQRQRVALARALAVRPAVLLADEPTAHLDHASLSTVLVALRAAADEGTAVLVATHDDEVHAVADRCLVLSEGRLVPGLVGADGLVPAPAGRVETG